MVTQEARDLLGRAKELRRQRSFDEAIELLEEAVRVARRDAPRSQLVAECLSWLGLVHSLRSSDEGSLRIANGLHLQALEIERELHGDCHERVAETTRLLAETLAQLGQLEDAFEEYSKSIAIAQSLRLRNRSYLDSLARFSHIAFELSRFEQAVAAALEYLALPLSDPLSILEEMSGHMSAGRALIEAKRPAEAVPHFERNLELALIRGRERGIAEMKDWVEKAKALSIAQP